MQDLVLLRNAAVLLRNTAVLLRNAAVLLRKTAVLLRNRRNCSGHSTTGTCGTTITHPWLKDLSGKGKRKQRRWPWLQLNNSQQNPILALI